MRSRTMVRKMFVILRSFDSKKGQYTHDEKGKRVNTYMLIHNTQSRAR